MAQCSTISVSTACFLWKTERPFKDVSRKSCYFSFFGAKWGLQAQYYYLNKEMFYKITLKKKKSTVSAKDYINVTTVLVFNDYSNNASIVYHTYQVYVQHDSETILWKYSEQSLTEAKSDFLAHGAWKIICTFHDILPSELNIENTTADSSTQMDEDTSTTAEKCIQVSRDFSDTDKLSEDLSNLLRLSLYPTAKLRCGDRTVPVHKSVLAARSPVFDTMFRDLSSDTFDVTDLDDKTLDPLLEYAYSGTVRELSDDTAVSLYEAGQKYGMDSLSKACSDWMILHLTPENCVSFLDAASSSDDDPLQEAVASFLCDHSDVFKSPDWIRFAEEQQSLAYKLIYMYTLRNL